MTKTLIRREEARRRLGNIADSTFYHWIAQGKLPRPVHIGRTSLWAEDEIDAAIAALKAERAPEMSAPAA